MTTKELLTELGISFVEGGGQNRHVTSNWLGVDCPSCSPRSGKYKLGIPTNGHPVATCWTCGKQPFACTLAELSGQSLGLILRRLEGLVRVFPSDDEIIDPRRCYTPTNGLKPLSTLPLHQNYLTGRGFDLAYLDSVWGVNRGTGFGAKLPWRVFLPVLDANGNDGSWTTRAVSDDVKLRYVNARPEEELRPIKSLLYGQHHLRHAVVICEGPTDAWKIGPGAVATFGVNYTKAQLLRMSKYPVRFVCFDSEPIAQQRAQALCEALIPFPGTTKNITLDAMDPGSASEKELRQLRRLLRGH